ncbi:MAG: DNA mismatch repair protein MutS, partial [Bdellovibrionales bacterium]|nr:DNA mismatch repair protein MutS [Bdellovibrionales bacterium]
EVFFEDAVRVARILNVTLTSRDKNDPNPIPMCGVPIHSIEGYLERLLDAGFSAALVSQVSAPSIDREKTQKGGMVERKLDRVVTPGVRLMAQSAGGSRSSASSGGGVVAVGIESGARQASIAWGDPSGTQIWVMESVAETELVEAILLREPSEVILPKDIAGKQVSRKLGWVKDLERRLAPNSLRFRTMRSDGGGRDFSGAQFALLSLAGKRASRLFSQYIDEVTVSSDLFSREVILFDSESAMTIDTTTRRNLELLQTARDGSYEGSLLSVIDCTITAGGARLLRRWVVHPLRDRAEISARHEAVAVLLSQFLLRKEIRNHLAKVPDLERVAARAELSIVNPRELGALRDGLDALRDIADFLKQFEHFNTVMSAPLLRGVFEELSQECSVVPSLKAILSDTPPIQVHDGGIVQDGYDSEVDSLRRLSQETEAWLESFQQEERERTGIASLKIRSNNAIGLYIEVSKSQVERVPAHYIPRQTLTNGARFVTEELRVWEKRLTSAALELQSRELEIFRRLQIEVKQAANELRSLHKVVSVLDVLSGFAEIAEEQSFTAPVLLAEDATLEAYGSWHPVLRRLIGERCIQNDIALASDTRCYVLTGPNMGGKSTYLRQVGLLVLLAQIGSFVPAQQMRFGVFDRIFARLGASDDLHEGDSTFMVEMREASNIVTNATSFSLVLIDEIGRGTATGDGVALARSLLEWIVEQIECRCIFATHYHQLIDLEQSLPTLRNISVRVEEIGKEVVFTHVVQSGPADRSYGIEVARRAGIPMPVLKRAEALLRSILSSEENIRIKSPQLSMFSEDSTVSSVAGTPIFGNSEDTMCAQSSLASDIEKRILSVSPDEITPREALDFVYELRQLCEFNRDE